MISASTAQQGCTEYMMIKYIGISTNKYPNLFSVVVRARRERGRATCI